MSQASQAVGNAGVAARGEPVATHCFCSFALDDIFLPLCVAIACASSALCKKVLRRVGTFEPLEFKRVYSATESGSMEPVAADL